MELMRQIDGYCERTDVAFWAEPINALSNLAFVIAAIWMWRASSGLAAARLLSAILFAIGVGSFLFHTFATVWAAIADVVPIVLFVLVYLYLVNRDIVGLGRWSAVLATSLFFPFSAGVVIALDGVPFMAVSAGYWAVPILILLYALALVRRAPGTARDMAVGALILGVSISLRSLDEALCSLWPPGTHVFWHLLNAIMLAWMIEVYRQFREEAPDE